MSLISTSLLDRIANEGKITDPAGMLSELGRLIQQALGQDRPGSPSDDGLDAAVCSFDAQTNTLTFSGVVLSLYQLKGGAVEEIRGDKQSVGYKASAGERPFYKPHAHVRGWNPFRVDLRRHHRPDRRGTGRAYGRKRFREVLVANAGVPLDILKAAVFDNLHGHQGTQVRRDNVTLIAFQPQ